MLAASKPAEGQRRTGTDAPGIKEVTGSKREPGFIGSDIDKRRVQTGNVIASAPFLSRRRSRETEKNSERRECRGKCFGEPHGFRLAAFMPGNRAENQQFFALISSEGHGLAQQKPTLSEAWNRVLIVHRTVPPARIGALSRRTSTFQRPLRRENLMAALMGVISRFKNRYKFLRRGGHHDTKQL
jgi:hypothetical protein